MDDNHTDCGNHLTLYVYIYLFEGIIYVNILCVNYTSINLEKNRTFHKLDLVNMLAKHIYSVTNSFVIDKVLLN